MTQQQIREALAGISQLLESNPELMEQQLGMLKAMVPDLDDAAMARIVEKVGQPGFNPRELQGDLEDILSGIRSASQE